MEATDRVTRIQGQVAQTLHRLVVSIHISLAVNVTATSQAFDINDRGQARFTKLQEYEITVLSVVSPDVKRNDLNRYLVLVRSLEDLAELGVHPLCSAYPAVHRGFVEHGMVARPAPLLEQLLAPEPYLHPLLV